MKLDEPTSNFGEEEYLEADADSREDFLIRFMLEGLGGPPGSRGPSALGDELRPTVASSVA